MGQATTDIGKLEVDKDYGKPDAENSEERGQVMEEEKDPFEGSRVRGL